MSKETDRILDGYLAVSARLGDRKAFGALAVRWQCKLLVHAWRLLHDEEAARDAVQDAWTEIARGLSRLRDEEAFAPWAYRIVTRRCAHAIRSRQAERRLEAAVAADQPGAGAPPAPGEALDHERVRAALRALPPEQQAAVALYYLEELGVAEVAVALDVPAGTVKTRLMHGRRKLRAALQGDE